ncbi:MAG: serine/threonine protein kinase [Candidatus Bathyarchaeota archaeon]|nr:serine/threonine protein kinase [Candidatus Bathyarchaeota archaeon]
MRCIHFTLMSGKEERSAKTIRVHIEKLSEEPYAAILCYPRASYLELRSRIAELREHGVNEVEFAGSTVISNVPVLGKGFVGVVIAAYLNGQKVALKIRRVDADRASLQQEAELLAKANAVQVGPRLIGVSRNFLLMQYIEGKALFEWLATHREKTLVSEVLTDILEQCWRLDRIGLDHGELSNAPKHLLIDTEAKPWIVDFETASLSRRPANVTSVCQFLFTSHSAVARAVAEVLGERNREAIIDALRLYKNERTRENFSRVIQACLA